MSWRVAAACLALLLCTAGKELGSSNTRVSSEPTQAQDVAAEIPDLCNYRHYEKGSILDGSIVLAGSQGPQEPRSREKRDSTGPQEPSGKSQSPVVPSKDEIPDFKEIRGSSSNEREPVLASPAGPPGVAASPRRKRGITGERGLEGEKGDRGVPGFPGLDGMPGQKGVKGDRGKPGVKGEPGTVCDNAQMRPPRKEGVAAYSQGERGFTSESGQKGVEPGPRDYSGISGYSQLPEVNVAKGDKGEIGLPGMQGERGDIGPKGDLGWAGPGLPGPEGPPGPKGLQGPPGPPGPPGESLGHDAAVLAAMFQHGFGPLGDTLNWIPRKENMTAPERKEAAMKAYERLEVFLEKYLKPDGSKEAPAKTCRDIQYYYPSFMTGQYWIDPNGGSTNDAILVHCDMETGVSCIHPKNTLKSMTLSNNEPKKEVWLSDIKMELIAYQADHTQLAYLQLMSTAAVQKVTFYCENAPGHVYMDFDKNIKLLAFNDVELHPQANRRLRYKTLLDECSYMESDSARTIVEYETDMPRRLPILDVAITNDYSPDSTTKVELGPVCFK